MTVLVKPYTKEGVESLRILPYTSVNVCVVNGEIKRSQRSKLRKSAWSMVKMPKRAGQNFDLVVVAVTIESIGVTPPLITIQTHHIS